MKIGHIFQINQIMKLGIYHFNDSKPFIEYSNDMQDVHRDIDKQNIGKERKILVVFDDNDC